MCRTIFTALLFGVFALLPSSAPAELMTGVTGGDQPFVNMQPSLAISTFVQDEGIYPSPGNNGSLGLVRLFAGTFGPGGAPLAQGQTVSIADNPELFDLIGTTYGGDGVMTFGLPDLGGRSAIHPGASTGSVGHASGARTITLTTNQMPIHIHKLPPSRDITAPEGGGQAFDNMQPSLALSYMVALQGVYPSRDVGAAGIGGSTFIGQVGTFAGNFAPRGWALAEGQLLSIMENQALFSLLGTTYGGDGRTNFALPDLRGRTPIGAGQGPGLSSHFLGESLGAQSVTLTNYQMPVHDHMLPPSSELTGSAGGGQPFDNMQPSLALNYIIATEGIYPPRDGGGIIDDTYLGEVALFAGNYAPGGWALADGRLLPIAQNPALFSLLGTTYGGNGTTTFALPDLRGRTALGTGQGPDSSIWTFGQIAGTETVTLSVSQLPCNAHTYVPEPTTLAMLVFALPLMAMFRRWRSRRVKQTPV